MPVREDPQAGAEQAISMAASRKGMRKTILEKAAEGKGGGLGTQTLLGQTQQQMYGPTP